MNKNGFTLVELLAVIVIIGLIATISVVGVSKLTGSTKEDLYCEKIKMITETVKSWGEDHKGGLISASTKLGRDCYCEYELKKLISSGVLKNESSSTDDPRIENPLMGDNFIVKGNISKSAKVRLYVLNNRVHGVFTPGAGQKSITCDVNTDSNMPTSNCGTSRCPKLL